MTAPEQRLSRIFYTYLWLRGDGTPYYVGKGYRTSRRRGRAYRKGSPIEDLIIVQDHESENAAFYAETFLISFYGRKDLKTGCLINLTDGGEGNAGRICREESRRLMSMARKGRPTPWMQGKRSEAFCRKLSEMRKGKPITHYDPRKHSERMTGSGNPIFGKKRNIDEQWRNKLSEGKRGHVVSEATRRKMSEARLGRQCGVKQDSCYRGHLFTPENTWVGKTGSRFCLECRKLNHIAANLRKKEKRKAAA